MRHTSRIFLALTIGIFAVPSLAEEQFSGFLEDYSQLQPTEDVWLDYIYTGPDFRQKVTDTTAFMVEQPEIFIAADSKYKGMKSDTVSSLSDEFRGAMIQGMASQYGVVENPGNNVLYVRFAITHLYIEKPKRGVLGYTPIGAVAKADFQGAIPICQQALAANPRSPDLKKALETAQQAVAGQAGQAAAGAADKLGQAASGAQDAADALQDAADDMGK